MLKRKRYTPLSLETTIVADRRTKHLCKRLQPGQIALLQHEDVDDAAAQSLLAGKVKAVINTSPFLTGIYPATGAIRLLKADVPLYEWELETSDVFEQLDGAKVLLQNDRLFVQTPDGPVLFASLRPITLDEVKRKWQEAHLQLDDTLSRFIDNTLMYAKWEKDLFLKPLPKLPLRTRMAGRHAVVVVRGKHYREDLQMLLAYINDCRPVLIAVDGGADALLERGYVPDLIIGDMDSISDRALKCGAEIIVHAYPDGRAPGKKRLEELRVPYMLLPAPGTSEDVAMLLAYEENAELIVTIGTHTNMIDFLEKGRKGMASTLLVRTKIGPKLVDAKGVSLLYQPRFSWNVWMLMGTASLVPILAVLAINPVMRHAALMMWKQFKMMFY